MVLFQTWNSKPNMHVGGVPEMFQFRLNTIFVTLWGSFTCLNKTVSFSHFPHKHTGQCKSTGGYLQRIGVVFFFRTGAGEKAIPTVIIMLV